MRGHFSIEWMAQSSLPAGAESVSACSTQSESLPGFYCRQKSEPAPEQGLGVYSQTPVQHQTPRSHQGNKSSMFPLC